MKPKVFLLLAFLLFMTTTATPARADVTLTPFIGSLFSGQLPTTKVAYGVSLTGMGAGIIGGRRPCPGPAASRRLPGQPPGRIGCR